MYFLCVIICRMEIWHRSDQGLSLDHGNSSGFSRAFLFLPLRTRHWPLHPSIPHWKPRGRGEECKMSMVRLHQHLWRERERGGGGREGERQRDGGARPDCPLLFYIANQGQKWNSAHSVQGVHLCTLLERSLQTDPGLWTKARLQNTEQESANHHRTNETGSKVWWIFAIWTTCEENQWRTKCVSHREFKVGWCCWKAFISITEAQHTSTHLSLALSPLPVLKTVGAAMHLTGQ